MTSASQSPDSGQGSSRSGSPDREPTGPTLDEQREYLIKRNREFLAQLDIKKVELHRKAPVRCPRQRAVHTTSPAEPRRSHRLSAMPKGAPATVDGAGKKV